MGLTVEEVPGGGFTVSDLGDEQRWWSVVFRGARPAIASNTGAAVDPHSREGRRILAAIREVVVLR